MTCRICKEKFDKEKNRYINPKPRYFYHVECYLASGMAEAEIIDPTDSTQCIYCKEYIKKSDPECVNIYGQKYAHKECKKKEDERPKSEEEQLHLYILSLFELDYVPPRIKKQITQYINDYNFTYTGIQRSLQYFYEVKHNPIEGKYKDNIGIVPFIYSEARKYFYDIFLAQKKNENKDISSYKPKVEEVRIPIPQRKVKKRKLFSFLDEEEK